MKQLQNKAVRPDLAQRRDGGVVEAVIGLRKHLFEVGKARIAFKEGRHDAAGSVGIIETGERGDLVRREAAARPRA